MLKRVTWVSLLAVVGSFLLVMALIPRPNHVDRTESAQAWQGQNAAAPQEAQVLPPEPSTENPEALLSPEDRSKLRVLREILVSRNDNDPRLDTHLRSPSVPLKQAIRALYQTLPDEDRSGRGVLVFLLGREIRSPEDVDFLARVVSEQPCLSFSDCKQLPPDAQAAPGDHHAGISALSLSNPELTGLEAFRKWLDVDRRGADTLSQNADLRSSAEKLIAAAKASANPHVAQRSRDLELPRR